MFGGFTSYDGVITVDWVPLSDIVLDPPPGKVKRMEILAFASVNSSSEDVVVVAVGKQAKDGVFSLDFQCPD